MQRGFPSPFQACEAHKTSEHVPGRAFQLSGAKNTAEKCAEGNDRTDIKPMGKCVENNCMDDFWASIRESERERKTGEEIAVEKAMCISVLVKHNCSSDLSARFERTWGSRLHRDRRQQRRQEGNWKAMEGNKATRQQ